MHQVELQILITTMYIKYAYGPVTVGYQESDIDASAASADDDFEAMGITYQVNDDLTIGYNGQHTTLEVKLLTKKTQT